MASNTTDYGAIEVNVNGATRFNQARVYIIPFGKQKVFLKSAQVFGTAAALLGLVVVIVVFANVSGGGYVSSEGEIALANNLRASEPNATTATPRPGRQQTAPTVRLTQGTLKGTVLQSRGGRDYNAFYTVPYGKAPVGNLRFQPPEPHEGWTGTRDATQKGPMCIQEERYNPVKTIVGSEDCLYVHIYTPKLPKRFGQKPNLAVIAYFFGGGFMHGTANDFGGDYFMDEDIIIVLVESRVGAMGFLNTGDLAATGNQGLKDQSLAMSWVKQNIEKFGGDPTRIIAFGTSSGAACSHLHLLSPMNSGVISGVMSFSGNGLGALMFDMDPRSKAVGLGQKLGCPDLEDSKALVQCLQNATAHDIAMNQGMLMPSIEAVPENGNLSKIFLNENPYVLQKEGRVNKVPWLTGVNSAEAILQSYTILLDPAQTKNVNENWNEWLTQTCRFQDTPNFDYSQKIRKFYFGDKPVSNETRYNLTNLMSDRFFVYPAVLSTELLAHNNATSFIYYLTKEANVSFADSVIKYFEPPYGVSHADEVQYFFPRPRYPYIPLDSEYAEFSKFLVKLWVSFANTGAPEAPNDWPPVKESDAGHVFYNLDDETKLIEPINDRIDFWNSLPPEVFFG